MKLKLVLLAMLLFGTVTAQTTVERTTVYHKNGTVELHIAVITIDTSILKRLQYNEVSKADVDNYLENGIATVAKAHTFSILHGPMVREIIVQEKDSNLHYGIVYLNGTFVGWTILVFVMGCMTISATMVITFEKKPYWLLIAPIATGLLFSIGTDIGYSDYHLNWDEQIGYTMIGLLFGVIVFLWKRLIPMTKSYWFRKRILLPRR